MTSTEAVPGTADAEGPPIQAATVCAAFQRVVAQYPDKTALRTLGGEFSLTWSQLNEKVGKVAAGLAGLGVAHGDTVAVLLPNIPECHILDYAAVHLGAVPFTIFNSSSAEQIEHQLRIADARIVITLPGFLPKVQQAVDALGTQVEHLIAIDDGAPATSLDTIESTADPSFDFATAWQQVDADDLVTLIYTSGTTGPPKGAQWSHRTVMAEQRALTAALPMPTDGVISFLPMAHAGGRITAHYMALVHGATITTCADMRALPAYLVDARPDAIFSVPRVWEKLQVGIEGLIEGMPDPEQRFAARRAVDVGLRWVRAEDSGDSSSVSEAEAAQLAEEHTRGLEFLHPVLAKLGLDNLKAAFVGGAPSAPELAQFFRAVGIPLLEAYGLTEGSLNVFNRVDDFRCGTAGRPLPGVELRLADDGEILVKAELNFVGYRKEPEQTAAALDAEGWLHTGDIATIDENGFLSIVDRKKEIIINSAGKNMSPAVIESAIKGESSLIGQVVAVGDRRPYVTALITLDPEAVPVYAKRLGLSDKPLEELAAAPEIRAEIQRAVDTGNDRLNRNEQIKKFFLIPSAWVSDSDELTPTAKLKRRSIHAKYSQQIEDLYAN
ncbi:AMP-binding protein [Nocardia sp. ET3-3]|uniref:AMP-binding protein n=1 Tax=Nocardia terrae TaxID=2675851 RepID=A0A7K1V2Q6_9NOCA|nr:AMP-dependent synthetase/ligase [Nocardia terrae]MVU80782.1 AMP-binding protein [Nocardia terrae]